MSITEVTFTDIELAQVLWLVPDGSAFLRKVSQEEDLTNIFEAEAIIRQMMAGVPFPLTCDQAAALAEAAQAGQIANAHFIESAQFAERRPAVRSMLAKLAEAARE